MICFSLTKVSKTVFWQLPKFIIRQGLPTQPNRVPIPPAIISMIGKLDREHQREKN